MKTRRGFLKNGALALVGTAAIPSFLTRAVMAQVASLGSTLQRLLLIVAVGDYQPARKRVRHKRVDADLPVVFLHTGGTPAVFAYRDELLEGAK